MKPPSSRAAARALTWRRAPPEVARSYASRGKDSSATMRYAPTLAIMAPTSGKTRLFPWPSHAHPNLFRPPSGIRALRAALKRRRRDRARRGHRQRRGRNRVGQRNFRQARALSRRQPRVLRGRVRGGAAGHGSGGAQACGRASRLQRSRPRRCSLSRLHAVDRLLARAAKRTPCRDGERAQAQSRLSTDPLQPPRLRAGGRDRVLRAAPRLAGRGARRAIHGKNGRNHSLRAAPAFDRSGLRGPSRQPRVRSRPRGSDGKRGAVDPRTHAHVLRLPRGRRAGDLQPARLPGRSDRVQARPDRGDLSSTACFTRPATCRAKSTRGRSLLRTERSSMQSEDYLERNSPVAARTVKGRITVSSAILKGRSTRGYLGGSVLNFRNPNSSPRTALTSRRAPLKTFGLPCSAVEIGRASCR